MKLKSMKNNNYIALSSLAMDLKRVAVSYYQNSVEVGERFHSEAIKRKREVNINTLPRYITKLLDQLDELSNIKNNLDKAEKALLLSTLFQNAAVSLSKNPSI